MCYKWIESVFKHVYSAFSQKKNDFVIETSWNVTSFSRPVAAPPRDRKKKLWSAPLGMVSYHGHVVLL